MSKHLCSKKGLRRFSSFHCCKTKLIAFTGSKLRVGLILLIYNIILHVTVEQSLCGLTNWFVAALSIHYDRTSINISCGYCQYIILSTNDLFSLKVIAPPCLRSLSIEGYLLTSVLNPNQFQMNLEGYYIDLHTMSAFQCSVVLLSPERREILHMTCLPHVQIHTFFHVNMKW